MRDLTGIEERPLLCGLLLLSLSASLAAREPQVADDFESLPVGAIPSDWDVTGAVVVGEALDPSGDDTQVLRLGPRVGTDGVTRFVSEQDVYCLTLTVQIEQYSNLAPNVTLVSAFPIFAGIARSDNSRDPGLWICVGMYASSMTRTWLLYDYPGGPFAQVSDLAVPALASRWYRLSLVVDMFERTARCSIVELSEETETEAVNVTVPLSPLHAVPFDSLLIVDGEFSGETVANIAVIDNVTFDPELPNDRLFLRGDCNDDGDVAGNTTDPLFLLNYLFNGGPEPPCVAACDANSQDGIDLTDAIYLLSFSFLGGSPPAAPYPECGPGTLPVDETTCETRPAHCQ